MDRKIFQNPGPEYRGKPFWAWNGELKKEEIAFQIGCLKEMGFGGAFLHSRTGLATEYMSDEWMRLVGYASELLNDQGMQAYLYDEDRWPSGTCGGLVTKTKEFRAKSMVLEEVPSKAGFTEPENFLGLFAVEKEGRAAQSCRKISVPAEAKSGEQVFVCRYLYMQEDSFYNGYTYLDTMNRAAADRFIELTHERYKKALGEKFGKEIVGIFTDEPHRGPLLNGFGRKEPEKELEIPYTYCLFEEFEKRRGYRIEERLPFLWLGHAGEKFCKEMYDLIEVEEELFLENFAAPYHEWCQKNNLLVTGHVLHEDTLSAQTTMCGSVMRYYEYMDYPGMDNLCEENYAYNVPALVRSAARQLGKKFVLDELYAATGWKMRFADYKRTGDWQSATGVTLRCPHLSWYTMKGEAKRDYPASFLHQSAWYKDFSAVEDYFARMHYLMTWGKSTTDTAIINPVESAWGLTNMYSYENCFAVTDPAYRKLENEYYGLYKELLLRGASVDYVDEGLFAKYGSADKSGFHCGNASYQKIILCGNLHLRSTTLSALKTFLREGGTVYVVGEMPQYLDGLPHDFSGELALAGRLPVEPAAAYRRIHGGVAETGDTRLIVTEREGDGERVILFLNATKEEFDASLRICTLQNCILLDLRTGEWRAAEYIRNGGEIKIDKHFVPDEEFAVLLTGEEEPEHSVLLPSEAVGVPESFSYKLDEPNFLVLDKAEYFIDGEGQGSDYVLKIDKELRARCGLEIRGGEMVQPWFKRKYFPPRDKKYCRLTLLFRFDCEELPSEAMLMTEEYSNPEIRLNGISVPSSPDRKTNLDSCFRLISLPWEIFRKGENSLLLSFDFYEETDVEAVYLCGQFGVRTGTEKDVLTALPERLRAGDFCSQGLPYYGGRVVLNAPLPLGEYCVETEDIACAVAYANGNILAFPPYRAKFCAKEGELKLELVMTRNNLFGCADETGRHSQLRPQGLCFPLKLYRRS